MSGCYYFSGTGYESVKVKKYDSAMKEHYETHEHHICQYYGSKRYHTETKPSSGVLKTRNSPVAKPSPKIKSKESDVAGTIVIISIVLAVIVAYFTYHNPSVDLNWLASSVITFVVTNIILHIIYGIFVAMKKLAEVILAITFWATLIAETSYIAGARWVHNLVSHLN